MTAIGELGARCLLVVIFLPFSALDKVLNYRAAIDQAAGTVGNRTVAMLMILCGFSIEVICSLGVITGIADRLAAFILAGYCVLTALLWKQFWKTPDFKFRGASDGRDVFWDFLKNFSLAGGFLLFAIGRTGFSL